MQTNTYPLFVRSEKSGHVPRLFRITRVVHLEWAQLSELPLLLILQLGVLLGNADRRIKGVIKGWPVAISTVLLAGRDRHISVGRRIASLDDQTDIGQRLSVVLGNVIHARVGQ